MAAQGGDWAGVMMSRDGGESFKMTSFPKSYYVTAFVMVSHSTFLVSARAHFKNRDDGGVWISRDGAETWTRTFSKPVYDLVQEPKTGAVLAALPWVGDGESVYVSRGGGLSGADWEPAAAGISWDGRTPFYPTFAMGRDRLFIGALTVNPAVLSDTASAIYHIATATLGAGAGGGDAAWVRLEGDPTGGHLDRDGMPKDRMALLAHPDDDSLLFVAGNAASLAWRVDWERGNWTEAFGLDTADGSTPHVDCRRYFWEPATGSLILLSDGGAWLRETPAARGGGRWRSLNGDTGAMELVSAHWDPHGKRWVGGAQDNSVMITKANATATDVAVGLIDGDGTVTAVDANTVPSRLWGAVENMGNAQSDDPGPGDGGSLDGEDRRRRRDRAADSDGDDDDCHGFGYYQEGEGLFCPPLGKWFSGGQFQQFVNPWALQSTDPTQVFLYASEALDGPGKGKPGGIYRLDVPYSARDPADLKPPTLEAATGEVYVIIAGGVTAGVLDPAVLVLLNDTHLLHRSATTDGQLVAWPLPVHFAQPVVTAWLPAPIDGEQYVLGPMTHDRTVSLAVSSADSALVAISGWTTIYDNSGAEQVWVSWDGGKTFVDVTAGLRNTTATIGQWRPSALLLLPIPTKHTTALLVGTINGVFVRFVPDQDAGGGAAASSAAPWARLGSCAGLPLVMVAGLSHQPKDDTLVAATMGRGVYIVHDVTRELEALHDGQVRQ